MSILITGSSGFLGTALSNYFNQKGISCIKLTRQKIEGSIQVKNYKDIPKADTIIHLGQCNDRNFVNNQDDIYLNKNIEIVDQLLNKNFKRFIYISSGSIYGDKIPSPRKVKESITPTDLYSEIKLRSEKLVSESKGIILRLSNIYGPGMSNKNVLSQIINKVNLQKEIHLDNGSSIRDFIWLNDVIEAIIKVIKSEIIDSTFNIGSGYGISINDLIKIVQSTYGTDLPVYFKNTNIPLSSIILDISETIKELNWEPKVSIYRGIYSLSRFKNQS